MKPLEEQPRLLELLKKYSPPGQDFAMLLTEKERKIRGEDMIVPFLGLQGTGKSTVLNALLGEPLLPVEADETTCVPVEIRYGDAPCAEVQFSDGRPSRTGDLSREELTEYVDNNMNPGNEKNVERIVLYRDHPLLQTGLVVVDLPGVGSLTHANERTTMQYIRDLCAAVFLISESPPIDRTTAGFLKSVWGGIAKAYFVQNVWDGDSEEEVQEGLQHNRLTLEDIARKINIPPEPEILLLNGYQAAVGSFRRDAALMEESGLRTVENTLLEFARSYRQRLEGEFGKQVVQLAEAAARQADEQIRQTEMSGEEVLRELNAQKEQFEQASAEISELTEGIDRQLRLAKRKVQKIALDIGTRFASLLQADIHETIDAGVYDGEQLSQVAADNQANRGREAIEAAYNELDAVWQPIGEQFEQIGHILEKEWFHSPTAASIEQAKEAKWEDGVAIVLQIGGAAGGVWAGAAAGAAAGAWAGPVGIAVGVAVAGLVGWIGNAIKQNKREERKAAAKRAAEDVIDMFRDRVRDAIEAAWNETAEAARQRLAEYAEERKETLQAMEAEMRGFKERGMKLERDRAEIERDAAYLREKSWA